MFDFTPYLLPTVEFIKSAMSLVTPSSLIGGLFVIALVGSVMVDLVGGVLSLITGSPRRSRRGGGRGGKRYNNRSGGGTRGTVSERSSRSNYLPRSSSVLPSLGGRSGGYNRGAYRPGSYGSSSRGFRSPGKLSDWQG